MNLEQIRAAIRAALEERAAQETALRTVREAIGANTPTAEQETARRAAYDAIVGIDARIDQLHASEQDAVQEQERQARAEAMRRELTPAGAQRGDRPVGGATVTREERTYSPEKSRRGEASFFVDAFQRQFGGDMGAHERLVRHMQEVRTEGEGDGREERATTTGSYGSLVVPQYLVDLAAPALRTGRPLANACQMLPLPDQGMTVTIPRGTTGAQAASQATENTALQNTDQVWADLQIPVRTVGGQQDVSRQSLERGTPGMDEIVYLDLAGSYHAELDRQVAYGSGAAGQMLGIGQTSGITAATAYGAAIAAGNFNSKIAGLIAAITAPGTAITPNMIAMHPRRWGWLTSLMDTTNRPLIVPSVGGPMNVLALNADPGHASGTSNDDTLNFTTVGSMHGLPLITDANLPTTVGTNSEDLVYVFDRRQALLWESGDKQPKRLRFEQTLGGQLTVKLVAYGYAAFTAARYPVAFGKAGGLDTSAGNGQIAPVF